VRHERERGRDLYTEEHGGRFATELTEGTEEKGREGSVRRKRKGRLVHGGTRKDTAGREGLGRSFDRKMPVGAMKELS